MSAGEGGSIAAENAEGVRATFAVTVNEKAVSVPGPVAIGRQIRAAAGLVPEADWVLIRIFSEGTSSIGLDEPVELARPSGTAFRAFESDRIFPFAVDGRGYEWGGATIGEEELRRIAHIPENLALVLERKGQPPVEIEDGGEIRLDGAGVERILTKKGLVKVFLDNDEKEIPKGRYTTEELVRVLGVELGYVLDVVTPDGGLEPIKSGQITIVRKGMRFISQAPCGGSS